MNDTARAGEGAASRIRLAFVVLLSIVPPVMIGILLIGYDYFDRERTRLERDALATARAMAAAVDAELTGARSALLVLATSPHLASGNLRAFHAQAVQAIKDQAIVNVILSDAGGRQLLNTFRPYGVALPAQGDPGGLLRVFQTDAPVISDLFTGRVTRQPIIGIAVPAQVGGRVRYSLSGGIAPERLSSIVQEQRLPAGWVAGIFDRAGLVVARSLEAQRFVGKPGPADLVRRMKQAPEAAFDSATLEGTPTLAVFSRSPVSGWTVALGIPQRELATHLLYSLARLFLVAFIVLAGSLVLGLAIARRFLRA